MNNGTDQQIKEGVKSAVNFDCYQTLVSLTE